VVLFATCADGDDEPSEIIIPISIAGKVALDGNGQAGAMVSVDNTINFSTVTDSNGDFVFHGVNPGSHLIEIKKVFPAAEFATQLDLFSRKVISVEADEDTTLETVNLMKPPVLDSTVTSAHAVAIKWTAANDPEFRSYQVLMSTSSDISEENRQLIYTSTVSSDTVFVATGLTEYTFYYFKVIQMGGPASESESNTLEVRTKTVQLIRNNSFERLYSNGYPYDWNLYYNPATSIAVDKTTAFSGSNSLKFSHPVSQGCYEMIALHVFNVDDVVLGYNYKLTFRYKSDFTYNGEANINLEYGANVYTKEISFNSSSGWQQFEIEFPMVTRYAFTVEVAIHFCVPVNGNWWIDDVTLAAD
jgi:hypothetical protein